MLTDPHNPVVIQDALLAESWHVRRRLERGGWEFAWGHDFIDMQRTLHVAPSLPLLRLLTVLVLMAAGVFGVVAVTR